MAKRKRTAAMKKAGLTWSEPEGGMEKWTINPSKLPKAIRNEMRALGLIRRRKK